MPAPLSFVSINIEYDKHLPEVTAFLKEKNPDVFCLQEVLERDVPYFEREFGAKAFFNPMTQFTILPSSPVLGTGIFSRLPVKSSGAEYYLGAREPVPTFIHPDVWMDGEINRVLSWVDVEKEEEMFRIATTHFTWSERGLPTPQQKRDMEKVLDILEKLGDFIFCGDLNAPRGLATWQMLVEKYTDNVPPQYQTSLDPILHRAPLEAKKDKMVDSLFSTPAYDVRDVEMVCGVSDHCALAANIAKVLSLKPVEAQV